mmetsp:Transcript_5752/g.8322  ORF Transcript_5752/g.8322 Transcript_5752/m.8322 type:complete len:135 (-) Transcript_5752:10-414(-)
MAMAERLDQKIGDVMMKVTRIHSQHQTQQQSGGKSKCLTGRDFWFDGVAILITVEVDFPFLVVCSRLDTFNEGAGIRVVSIAVILVKDFVNHVGGTFGALVVNLVTHLTVRAVVRTIVLLPKQTQRTVRRVSEK